MLWVSLLGFFVVRAVTAVCWAQWRDGLGFGLLSLCLLIFFRGLFVGLADALFVPRRKMDVEVRENAAGILMGRERWYLFLDGITRIERFRSDLWTFLHFNGSVLHVPVSTINEEQMAHIRRAMERGQTPEGIRAVVGRGRKIAELRRRGNATRRLS